MFMTSTICQYDSSHLL